MSVVLGERSGPVLRIVLNRPERLNAVSEELYTELLNQLQAAVLDSSVRCVVLTGAGRAFSAGADLKAHRTADRSQADRATYVALGQQVCERIQKLPVPVVAEVRGYALGAGAEMAVSADFLVMAEDAKMGFPEVALGTFVGGGVTHRLPRLVGLRKATDLLLLGERFTGAQAVQWGLAHQAPPEAELTAVTDRLVSRLSSLAPLSVRRMKAALARDSGLDDALQAEAKDLLAVMGTDDWAEGVAAFGEGREPEFLGR
ncbi:enoyl-CoA hydratase/isomerase family protein [Amycolatopsis taiwanensis]|uniref:Crotonase n=1 Tax=Amycolatopsis taiwanensis TaxID=342230 RepID=A0A9W6R1J5_9PSEU|nr:enoyl-CoA hydratase/isomerase family protein [Amycolatopsis taiwanensis]GLY65845.1 crotonase [Amycolatopsis taiwanensis]